MHTHKPLDNPEGRVHYGSVPIVYAWLRASGLLAYSDLVIVTKGLAT